MCVCVRVFVCVCVCVCVCGCVWPSPSIGRCQVTGTPCHWLSAGFLLEQSHCSQHYHKLMRKARARLSTHTLICSSDVTRETQTMSTPKHMNLKTHLFLLSFGFPFPLSECFPPQEIQFIQSGWILKTLTSCLVWKSEVFKEMIVNLYLNVCFLLCATQSRFVC